MTTCAPAPKEIDLHVALTDLVRRTITPHWRFTHIPLGEKRDPATAAKLQRMGVQRSWPDFIFVGDPGGVFFLELKRPGESATKEQKALGDFLMHAGCGYLCTDDLEDAIWTLRAYGIVRARVSA